jgi:hypothetical protein
LKTVVSPDTPEEDRCVIPLLSEEEEGFRSTLSMKAFLKRERAAAINRLHALYAQAGISDVAQNDGEGREYCHRILRIANGGLETSLFSPGFFNTIEGNGNIIFGE